VYFPVVEAQPFECGSSDLLLNPRQAAADSNLSSKLTKLIQQVSRLHLRHMGMGQYLLIPFLVG
jgi:hypothetical protein